MATKPTLRVDLGLLDPYFEQRAMANGRPVHAALDEALAMLLSGQVLPARPSKKRVRRCVTFASKEEHRRAQICAKERNQTLTAALRAIAIEQLLVQTCPSTGTAGHFADVASTGVQAVLGLDESSTERLELRFRPSELSVLREKVRAGRYQSVQKLVIAITRAFLLREPVLAPTDIVALGQHNLELVHISHALRQITHTLESDKSMGALYGAKAVQMLDRVEAHIEQVAKALSHAQGRWTLQEA